MTDNFNLIKCLMGVEDDKDIFFHLQIIRRGKDHPNLPAANKTIQTWLIHGTEHLDKLRDDIVFLCEHYQARAYINITPKRMADLNTMLLWKLAENINNHNVVNPYKTLNSAIGLLQGTEKRWIVDIDSKDSIDIECVKLEIDRLWVNAHPEDWGKSRESGWMIAQIATNSGWHLITRPFNLKEFKERCPYIDVHKNNPTILYIPKSLER